MGQRISKLCDQFQPDKNYILVVGLQDSGKTTFIYCPKLKPGWEGSRFEHTMGYNYEEIRSSSGILSIFDTPGDEALFPIVKNLYKNLSISGVIFIFKLISNTRPIDFINAKRKLKFYANEPELKNCAFAIIGNTFGDIENQFKSKEYLRIALGIEELKHIENKKEIFIFDAKFNPKECEAVWRWMGDIIDSSE